MVDSEVRTKGIILVGGPNVGTRFRPLSMETPKPLFPIAGKPMIYHHIQALSLIPGLKEILLIGFYDQQVFDDFLKRVNVEFKSIKIRYLREYQPLSTGGGLYHFRDEICRGDPSYFFVLNADIACSFPLIPLLNTHLQKKCLATILGIRIDRKEVLQFGCIAANPETNEVIHFVEKPESSLSDMISCGIYVLSPQIFNEMRTIIDQKRQQFIEQGGDDLDYVEIFQLESDLIAGLTSSKKLYVHECSPKYDFWMQMKTPSSTIIANRLYLTYQDLVRKQIPSYMKQVPGKVVVTDSTSNTGDIDKRTSTSSITSIKQLNKSSSVLSLKSSLPYNERLTSEEIYSQYPTVEIREPCFIDPSSVLGEGIKLGPNVSIGPNVIIENGVRIRDSIILDNARVNHDSCIINTVLGWSSVVGAWARVEGESPDIAGNIGATRRGFKSSTATIIGKNVTIKEEIAIRNCIVLSDKSINYSQHNEILM